VVPDVLMGARFKTVSGDDAYPGEAQTMGRKKISQAKEIAPDATRKTHMPMNKHFFTDVNRFS
jgi:hypothetical protein